MATAKKKTTTKKAATKKVAAKKEKTVEAKAAGKTSETAKKTVAKKVEAAPIKKVKKLNKPKNVNGTYTQTEFVEHLQAYCGLAKKAQAKEFLADFSELISDSLKKGYKVPLPGIGKMFVRKTKARKMPKPGEPSVIINVPARKKVRFTVAKSLKDAVL